MSESKYLSVEQLADELGVEVGTIYHWNRKGVAPPRYKLNGLVRYRRSEVEKWIAERVVND